MLNQSFYHFFEPKTVRKRFLEFVNQHTQRALRDEQPKFTYKHLQHLTIEDPIQTEVTGEDRGYEYAFHSPIGPSKASRSNLLRDGSYNDPFQSYTNANIRRETPVYTESGIASTNQVPPFGQVSKKFKEDTYFTEQR